MAKYTAVPPIVRDNRQWPDNILTEAPKWCSVDLRDGNQALPNPMSVTAKAEFFALLCEIGFKEIEIGFPAASDTEFEFCRHLIANNLIPEDVTVQVLTQAKAPLIVKTFEALKGYPKAIIHVYNSTSPAQRKYVFNKDEAGIVNIATEAAELIKELAVENASTQWTMQYSPESFSQTELSFSLEICNAVSQIWHGVFPVIINLPATVESSTPNVYADQIEWMRHNLKYPCTLSVHTHNDRGCGIAATELAILAGATRVEGTLFGNGERTGNADIVTLALNLMTQGVDSQLNFSNLPTIRKNYENLTDQLVPDRHPYAGNLVFTAFSGSHQDAIAKGLKGSKEVWDVPYLPIDPKDIGRDYEPLIRINSQSGAGGLGYILEQYYGIKFPKELMIDVSKLITSISDASQKEMEIGNVINIFKTEYFKKQPLTLSSCEFRHGEMHMNLAYKGITYKKTQAGTGPIDAATSIISELVNKELMVSSYCETALGEGQTATAIAVISVNKVFGVGLSKNIEEAAIKALISAINRI